MCYNNPSIFFGREEDINSIEEVLFNSTNNHNKILCINGKEGIGKTALINKIKNTHRDSDIIYFDSFGRNWESFISNIAQRLNILMPSKLNYDNIENVIIKYFQNRSSILILDNLDNNINCNIDCIRDEKICNIGENKGKECNKYRIKKIESFIEKWIHTVVESKLVVLTRKKHFIKSQIKSVEINELKNINTWWQILGEDCRKAINNDEKILNSILGKLNYNTQKVIYLRMCSPENEEACESLIAQINKGQEILDEVDKERRYSLSHFYALGLLETLSFDETLFAFLWDRLGGGSTEEYINTLRALLDKKIISQDKNVLYITDSIHVMLTKRLKFYFKKNYNIISYLIAQYYLKQFDSNKLIKNLQSLELSVKHALNYGSFEVFEEIYSYIFSDEIWNIIRRGQAVLLFRIVEHFDNFISKINLDKLVDEPKLQKYFESFVKIKIERAKILADLCEYDNSISNFNIAQQTLIENARFIQTELIEKFITEIRHFQAISYSCVGNKNCIDAYESNVIDAIKRKKFNQLEVLSLGYLAHELMFYDIDKARKLANKAYLISKDLKDENLQRKNACNYGKILFYSGDTKNAETFFNKADSFEISTETTETDKREKGRIGLQKALIAIKNKEEATKANGYFNVYEDDPSDERRAGVAKAYQGINYYKKGDYSHGKELMLKAIDTHKKINDIRHLVFEILTYVWMLDNNFSGNLNEIELQDNRYFPIIKNLTDLKNGQYSVYVNFWKNYFKEVVLL